MTNIAKPKLVLHIGSHKTGTTALQRSLAKNAINLQEIGEGLFYCLYGRNKINHISFTCAIINEFISDIHEDHGSMPAKIQVDHIKKSFFESGCKTLILSSEKFSYPFKVKGGLNDNIEKNLNKFLISYVKNHFREFDICVVIYLRRQDDYLESFYNQTYKNGKTDMRRDVIINNGYLTTSQMHEYINLVRSYGLLNYYDMLAEWGNVYGKENIFVRVYERSQMPNGTVYDFYKHVLLIDDIKIESLLSERNKSNESINKEVMECINAINQYESCGLSGVEVCSFIKSRSLSLPYNDTKNILTAKQASDILEFYRESNKKVAIEYLQREDGVLFRDKLRDEADDYKGLTHEATFYISREIIFLYKEKYKRLREANELFVSETEALESKNNSLSELKAKLKSQETKLKNIQNSTSWKITKPLRVMTRFLRKIRNRIRRSK